MDAGNRTVTPEQRENRKVWAEALLSDKYKQCTGQLYNVHDDAYCCLGVAKDLFDLPVSSEYPEDLLDADAFKKHFGFHKKCGNMDADCQLVFSECNDWKCGFKQIGDYLLANLDSVCVSQDDITAFIK